MLEKARRLGDDFGTNAVTREDGDEGGGGHARKVAAVSRRDVRERVVDGVQALLSLSTAGVEDASREDDSVVA